MKIRLIAYLYRTSTLNLFIPTRTGTMNSLNLDVVDRILFMADKSTQSSVALISQSWVESARRALYRVVDFSIIQPDFCVSPLTKYALSMLSFL